MIEITNLTKTKIDLKFLPKAARAAFAVLRTEKKYKIFPPPQLRRGIGGGGVQNGFQHPTSILPSSEGRRKKEANGLKDISLVLVSEAKIRELNRKYRHKNEVTDVLSFEELNEIYICLPQAKKQSQLLKTSLNSELTRLLVHGIVHLKGYDHERSQSAELEMQEIEKKFWIK